MLRIAAESDRRKRPSIRSINLGQAAESLDFFRICRHHPKTRTRVVRTRPLRTLDSVQEVLPMQAFRSRRSVAQSPLETYLREINETPLLNAAQEKELARRIWEGDNAARDCMVRANLRLVVNIARNYVGKGLDLPDLIEEGNLGLLRAVEGFDPGMNTRFSTYAGYWIKQSIKRALINTGKTIRIPAYMAQLLTEWRRATAELQEDLGRPPTQEEIAAHMKLPRRKLNLIKK